MADLIAARYTLNNTTGTWVLIDNRQDALYRLYNAVGWAEAVCAACRVIDNMRADQIR